MVLEAQTKTETVQTEIAAAWVKDEVVSGPVIKRYLAPGTTPKEEAELGYSVEAHERVKIDLGSTDNREHTLDVAISHVIFKPKA